MEKPDLKPSPLLDPRLLRGLPIATRMYIIGNFIRDLIEYQQSTEIELFKGNSLVSNRPDPQNKTVNIITKANSPGTSLPNTTGGKLQTSTSGIHKLLRDGGQRFDIFGSLKTNIGNKTNPINSFFNVIAEQSDIREPVIEFPKTDFIRQVEELLNIGASQFGVDVVDIFKEDVNTLSEAMKLFQDFVKSDDGIVFNPAILSSKFPEETKNFDVIKKKLNAYDKNALNTLFKGVEALESLMTPILNMNEGHSLNDQRWLMNSKKALPDDIAIGSIIDTGDVVDRNDPALLRNIKIKTKEPVEQFSSILKELISDNRLSHLEFFVPYAASPSMGLEENTLYPTAKQFKEILADLGIDMQSQFKNTKRKQLFDEAYNELINTLKKNDTIEDIQMRYGNIQKAYSKMFSSLIDNKVIPNFDYQLFSTVNRFKDDGFRLGRKDMLRTAPLKEKAAILLHEILYDPTVNNNFQNVEKILASIVAESPLDVNYYDAEGYKFDIFKNGNFNDVNANKAWLADTFVNSVKGKKALIEKLNPEFGSLLFPNKAIYSKYAENLKDIPEEIKGLIHKYADNLGIDWMADIDNFKQVRDAVQKEDPAAFAKINKYYNSVAYRDGQTNTRELFKFKPTNWQDDTNLYVYRQVQEFLSSHPNLDKTIFTDDVIRKGITKDGRIDDTSKLYSMLQEINDISPEFILQLEGKISSIHTNAQEAVQLTRNGFQGLDAKLIPALMNKKHNVASLGQMLVAASKIRTRETFALDPEGALFKLSDNPNANTNPGNYDPFTFDESMFLTDGDKYGTMRIPDLEYGYQGNMYPLEEAQYIYSDIEDKRIFTLQGLVDDLMNDKVRTNDIDAKYPVIFNDEFTVMDRNEIIDNLFDDLRVVLSDPQLQEEFVKQVVSQYGDQLPPIVQEWMNRTANLTHENTKINFPKKFGEKVADKIGEVSNSIKFSTLAEDIDGNKLNLKLPGMTTTYSSQFNFLNDTVQGRDFTNHVFISTAKELFNSGYEDIAKMLLDIEGAELDLWNLDDWEDVVKELKNMLITEIDRGDGGEIAGIITTTGGESPYVSTKNTLRPVTFDTLGHSVLEGLGARGEIVIIPPNAKGLDLGKWSIISRNNVAKNMVYLIPGQGEKIPNGTLQQLQDALNPPNIINLVETPQSGLGVKLQAVEGIDIQTGEKIEDYVPEYPFNWLDRAASDKHIHPVNGKYQIGKSVSTHANTIIEGVTPTQIPVELIPTGLSKQVINEYLKNKEVNNIDDVVNKKNRIIQSMQNAVKSVNKYISNQMEAADLSVAYIKTDELLKFIEDNRLKRGSGLGKSLDKVHKIASDILENGYRIPETTTPLEFKMDKFYKIVQDFPVLRFNPNNNAVLLQEGNHRVQAMKLLGMEYTPVYFQLDPKTVAKYKTNLDTGEITQIINKDAPLSALGTNQDTTVKLAAGVQSLFSDYDEGITANATWKLPARYIHDPEINKNILTPISTMSDYTMHPNYGTLAMYQNFYMDNLNDISVYEFFDLPSDGKKLKMERVLNYNKDAFVNTVGKSIENMDIALEGIRKWFNKYGSKQDKQSIKELIKYHPNTQDFAAYMNTVQNVNEPAEIDIFSIKSSNTRKSADTYANEFKRSLENTIFSNAVSSGNRGDILLPTQGIDELGVTTKGKMKVRQILDSHHSVFDRKLNMAAIFLSQNKDMFGPGNILLPNDELQYLDITPQNFEVAGINAANDIHSATFDNLLQVTVDEGIMSMEDAIAYKDAQSKSRIKELFKVAEAQSKYHKQRLASSINSMVNYAQTKIRQGSAFLADDFKFNTVKGQQLVAFDKLYPKVSGGLKTAGRIAGKAGMVAGTIADVFLIPAEIIALGANTIKYYEDPDFGAATGLGKYGFGPKELFQNLRPGQQEGERFMADSPASAIVKTALNTYAWLAMNTKYKELYNNPEEFSPMVRPQNYDPETHGKNLRQLYFGLELNPKGILDNVGGEKTFIQKQKQPFIQDVMYGLVRAFGPNGGLGPLVVDGKYIGDEAISKRKDDLYEKIGNFANIEEDNGN